MNRLSKIIGLTIGPKSLLLAEVAAKAGSRPAIQKLAELPYPDGVSLSTPAELGQALGVLLRSQGFTVKDAIIGLPARRLLTRRKEVPPANEAVAASTLRLQAEGEFAGESDSFAIDYAGQTSSSAATAVMLVAAEQSCIDQCQAMAKAAGLRLRGITAASAALGWATSSLPGGDGLVVTLAAGSAELVVQHGKASTQLRHLAVSNAGTPESMGALAGEIRRTMATMQQNGTPPTLALWDDSPRADGSTGSMLEKRLGMPVTSPELRSIALLNGAQTDSHAGAYASAVAVAMSAMDAAGPPVDFLHSRLEAPKEATNKRPIMIASIVGGIILLAIIAGFVDLQIKQATLDKLNATHNARATQVKKDQTESDRLIEARKWTAPNYVMLACLRDFTNIVPDGPGIWVTNFSLDSKNQGKIVGKAYNQAQINAVVEKLRQSATFQHAEAMKITDVSTPGTRFQPGVTAWMFQMPFTYKPAAAPKPGQAGKAEPAKDHTAAAKPAEAKSTTPAHREGRP